MRRPDGEARAVERVHEFGLGFGLAPEADRRAARLEIGAVRAGADLAVGALTRHPDLEVVRLGRVEADVAAAQRDDPVGQPEFGEQVPQHRASVVRVRRTSARARSARRVRLCRTDAGGSGRACPCPPRPLPCESTACRRCSAAASAAPSRISSLCSAVSGTSAVGIMNRSGVRIAEHRVGEFGELSRRPHRLAIDQHRR